MIYKTRKLREAIKLHIGAFDCGIDGWVNTDITPHIWVSRVPGLAQFLWLAKKMSNERLDQHRRGVFRALTYVDLTKKLPFADETVSAVFSSHVFEHLFADEVERLVAEIRRVLVPGGVCRVVVPDLEKIVALFRPEDPRAFVADIFEIGRRSDVKNAHHTGFTSRSLVSLFERHGYSKTSLETYRHGACPDIDLLDNRPQSIFFEAFR